MSYAIIGFGKIGHALAKAFARSGIAVSVATTRDPESFASDAAAIGAQVIPATLAEAAKADVHLSGRAVRIARRRRGCAFRLAGKDHHRRDQCLRRASRDIGRTAIIPVRRAGVQRCPTGQGLQPSGRCRPRPGSGRARWKASRVPVERR